MTLETRRHVPVDNRTQRRVMQGGDDAVRLVNKRALNLQECIVFVEETLRKGQEIPNISCRVNGLKCHCIWAVSWNMTA